MKGFDGMEMHGATIKENRPEPLKAVCYGLSIFAASRNSLKSERANRWLGDSEYLVE